MKFFTTLAIALFAVISVNAAPTQKLRTSSRHTADEIAEIRQRVRGCNANVCFAIDGSGSINSTEYRAELQFVQDLVGIITVDNAAEVAAVQYGVAGSAISPLTIDIEQFLINVEFEPQIKSPRTFVAGGINYCFSQLFRRRGEANKIVLLGDGRSSIGASAIRRADLFRSAANGDVCAVGAGFTDDAELLGIAGGDPDRVFLVNSFLDVLKLEGLLEAIVADICDLEPKY